MKVIQGKRISTSLIAWREPLREFGMTRTWQQGTNMLKHSRHQEDLQHLQDSLIPKLPHQPQRETQKLSPIQRQKQHRNLFFHHHSRSNMQRAKGRKVSRVLDRLVRTTNPKFLAISTSLRNHVQRVKIAHTAMIRRSLTSIRRREKAKGAANLDLNHPQTRRRKLMSHVGLGRKGIAISVKTATEDMMNICSTLRPQRAQQHRVQPQL